MATDKDIFDGIALSYEANKINEALQDERVTRALMMVAKLIVKPHVPMSAVGPWIVELQALSMEFHLRFKYYMGQGASEPDAKLKKNYYATLSESIEKVVSALKYIPKT